MAWGCDNEIGQMMQFSACCGVYFLSSVAGFLVLSQVVVRGLWVTVAVTVP